MKTYEWVIFDADETLFHFDALSGLQIMFNHFGIQFTKQNYEAYQKINKPLWLHYHKGLISAEQLQHTRFKAWASRLNVSTQLLNNAFLEVMADICTPIEGAIHLLSALKNKVKLGIITNGFTKLQQARLEKTGLEKYFELLVISEEIGVAKPHVDIFNHAVSRMNNPARELVLMVGDNLDTDIVGGINAGLDTCWFNMHKNARPKHIKPTFQVASLIELKTLLLGDACVSTS